MQKLSSFGRGKKIRPKKSLTWLLYKALQIQVVMVNSLTCGLWFDFPVVSSEMLGQMVGAKETLPRVQKVFMCCAFMA